MLIPKRAIKSKKKHLPQQVFRVFMPYVIDCIVYIILFLQPFCLVLNQLKADENVVAVDKDGSLY